jgi:hypothetical protein
MLAPDAAMNNPCPTFFKKVLLVGSDIFSSFFAASKQGIPSLAVIACHGTKAYLIGSVFLDSSSSASTPPASLNFAWTVLIAYFQRIEL